MASGYCICMNINLVIVRMDIGLIRLKNHDKFLVIPAYIYGIYLKTR
jgi:hypothetical protein